jgi:hypothetical protein
MKTYKVTIELENVVLEDDSDADSVKESVKDAVQIAVEMDDNGDEELKFQVEEEDEDCF